MNMQRRTQIIGLLGWIFLCFVAAAFGGLASATAGSFYRDLVRPEWAPPAWLFGPAWTILYCMMAVSAWLVWRVNGFRAARGPLTLFIVQLVLNGLWTWLFFGLRNGALAFAEILILWAAILATLVSFRRLHRTAGALLIPYLGWVTFASALTFAVWNRNPGLL
jgi:benzodiazapine receptor